VTAPLPRAFFASPAIEVAPAVLGRILASDGPEGRVALRITEVEAYAGEGEDPGSHAHRGRTPRNAVMFGMPGHLYVYFTYGMHWCANLVCSPVGAASAVLLRAGEIVEGVKIARRRRSSAGRDAELARGPARLAQALGFTGAVNGVDLCGGSGVFLYGGRPADPSLVRRGPRTGVGGAGADRPWRFWLDGEPTVSPYRPHIPKRRPDNGVAAAEPRTEESSA
jgi:DNA-3-methyladenine glycosylase